MRPMSPKTPIHVADLPIRRLWPTDSDLYHAHLMRLDPESRHSRFGGAVSDTYLADYASHSIRPDTLIYGAFDGADMVAAGELRILFGTWPLSAETAFSVERAYQDHGLGDLLLNRIITAARNRGIYTLGMQCLSHNQKMRHLAQKHSAELSTSNGETEARLMPFSLNPASLIEEWLIEADATMSRLNPWKSFERPKGA
jgi:GNAT superfamily N-acetyltransferase